MSNTQNLTETVGRLYSPMPRPFHGHGTAAGLHRLRTIAVLEAQLEIAKREYVHMARAQDQFTPDGSSAESWETIGEALGISRQAAWERYRD